ncbi:MAG: TolC family protein [Pseudomonadota bacterium]
MKPLIRFSRPRVLVFALCFGVVAGCYTPHRYSYEGIREEYAGSVCLLPDDRQPEKAMEDPCRIDKAISLKDAILLALANNPDGNIAAARIKQAAAMLQQTDALFYPYVGFYTEYSRGDSPSSSLFKTIDQRMLAPNTDFNDPGVYDNFETGIQGWLNLFNGGRDVLQRGMAERDLAIRHLDQKGVENSLVASVIRSYYNCLAAEDHINIVNKSIETVSEQLRIMNIRFAEGGALKSDILTLNVRLAQVKEDLVQSRNRMKIAKAVLAGVMGISADQEIVLTREAPISHEIPGDFSSGMMAAVQKRPELQKIRKHLEQSRMSLDMAKSGYLPRVDLQGKYYVDDPDMDYDRDRENWMAAVVLNWDLFTGFSTRSERAKAAAGLEELLAVDRKTLLEVRLDVKTAYLELEAAEARVEVAKNSVEMAEESLQLVKKQFDGGSATVTRYLEAELARNTARTRSTAAYYDREIAIANVGRSIGFFTGRVETE